MRRWKLALSVAVVLGLAIWGFGIRGGKGQPDRLDNATPRLRSIPPATAPAAPKTAHLPAGSPRFTASFQGNRLDLSTWATCYPYMDLPTGCTNFGNPEYQWYLPSQVRVSQGNLNLVAQRVPTAGRTRKGAPKEYGCRSGMVTTYPSLRFEYGYLRIVARIPAGRGLWPALWLAAANQSWPPEIDILEAWDGTHAGAFFHPVGGARRRASVPPRLAFGWHTFGLSWSRSRITWTVDGKTVLTVRSHVPHQKMYLLVDLAESQVPSQPTDCTGTLLVRSVKFWQNPAAAGSS
jgi:beta-glucanase (GH16 family)